MDSTSQDLIERVVLATGLPDHLIRQELQRLASKYEKNLDHISLEELRSLIVSYLQEELIKTKKYFKSYPR